MHRIGEELCKQLAEASTDVAAMLLDHLRDNTEVLPAVFLSDVGRYAESDGTDRQRIVFILDTAMSSANPKLQETIAVSFIEHFLHHADEFEAAVRDCVAVHLRKEWQRMNAM